MEVALLPTPVSAADLEDGDFKGFTSSAPSGLQEMAEKGASGSGFPAQKYQEIFISQGWPILISLVSRSQR